MVLAATGVGIGIGHEAWGPKAATVHAASGPIGGGSSGGSTNSGGFGGFGAFANPGNSGNSGSGNSGSGGSGNSGSGGSGNSGGGFSGGFFSDGGSSSGSTSSAAGSPSDVSAIAAKVSPGLVDINTTLGYQQAEAAGTGIVLTSSGEILTNNHVIDGATRVSVTDIGNGRTYEAKVVGYNVTEDIAVLQLQDATNLQTAAVGNSSAVAVGEAVVAIGNAGGAGGKPSAAGGSVTALKQAITASDASAGTAEQLTDLIQVNSDVQSGDSGGSLVDSQGKVVGVDTAASSGFAFQSTATQGYAIPINRALSIAKAIETSSGSSTVHIGPTAFLGVKVEPPGQSASGQGSNGYSYFGDDNGSSSSGSAQQTTAGALITGVVANTPAAKVGLGKDDVITSLDGKSVASPTALTSLIGQHHPGDKVAIAWTDASGQSHSAVVDLGTGAAA